MITDTELNEWSAACAAVAAPPYGDVPLFCEPDARFVALARAAMPRLIEEVRRLRDELTEDKYEGDW